MVEHIHNSNNQSDTPTTQQQEPSVLNVVEAPAPVPFVGDVEKEGFSPSASRMSLAKMMQSAAPHAAAAPTTTTTPSTASTTSSQTTTTTSTASQVEDWLEDIHKWLIVEGSSFSGVQSFLTAYFSKLLDLKMPVDMIFGGGVLLSEYTPGYIWTCENTNTSTASDQHTNECAEIEISRAHFERYNANLSAEDPFVMLREQRATSVRLRKGLHTIPEQSCPWYHAKGFTDYFALPILHRGVFKGGFAWVTRSPQGFSADVLQFLERAMPAFAAIMRLQTNDCVMESLTVRVEEEIRERTSSLQEKNQELAAANLLVQQQAAAQLEHFACMSHEVRTPLNCIIGLSNLMLEGEEELTPSQRDSIQLITTSGDLLRTVVDDVLDYTKLAAGHLDIHIVPTNLQEVMQHSVRAFAGPAQVHALNFRLKVSPNVPASIESDPRRLSQILYNLLGNAVKFSKDGANIDIALSLGMSNNNKDNNNDSLEEDKASEKQPQPQQQVLKLAIKDYGKGIAKTDLETIFQPFHQTEASTSDSTYGGTGLGLSIASKIVHGLGGTISADSEVGEWCEFTVELPCATAKAVDVKEVSNRLQTSTNVLVILMPDSEERQRLLEGVLGPYGVTAHVLNSCSELDSLLHSSSTTKSYLCICDQTLYDAAALENFATAAAGRVKIVTCGSSREKIQGPTDAHYESLSLVFPSVLMQSLCQVMERKNIPGILSKPPHDHKLAELQQKPLPGNTDAQSRILTPPQASAIAAIQKAPTAVTTTATAVSNSQYACLKVLITEDNRINQKVLHKALSRLGLQNVDIVDNGAKAVALTAEKPFDLIFMDIQMPVMDGLEATRLITARRRENGINKVDPNKPTVIFLSAHATENYKEKALAVGGDGFIAKPFQLPKLEEALQSAIRSGG